jgi:hypothetical protein
MMINAKHWTLPLTVATFLFIASAGCSSHTPEPAGAKVTLEQAKAVANDIYIMKKLKRSELRHLK